MMQCNSLAWDSLVLTLPGSYIWVVDEGLLHSAAPGCCGFHIFACPIGKFDTIVLIIWCNGLLLGKFLTISRNSFPKLVTTFNENSELKYVILLVVEHCALLYPPSYFCNAHPQPQQCLAVLVLWLKFPTRKLLAGTWPSNQPSAIGQTNHEWVSLRSLAQLSPSLFLNNIEARRL